MATKRTKTEVTAEGGGATETTVERVERISPKHLHPTKWNPREHINTQSAAFQDLLKSVEGSGVREHLQVRPHPSKKGEYEILSGHRRALAATMAKVETVPVVIVEMDDEEAFKQVFFGNFGREDLTPAEEGRAVEILLQRMRQDTDAVAAALGKSVQWVAMRARLMKLTPKWRATIEDPAFWAATWSLGHLALIARLPEEMQDALLATDRHYALRRDGPGWTVKQLDAWLNNIFLRRLASAPWSREDATLVKAAGACTACGKKSSCQGRLFIEAEDDATRKREDRCMDPDCWRRKLEAWTKHRVEQAKQEHGGNVLLLSTSYLSYQQDKEIAKRYDATLKVAETSRLAVAKAGQKGAVPGIVVNGDGLGQLRWVKKPERESYSSGSRREKRKPLTLKERREVLENKRLSVVLKLLRAALTRESDVAASDKSGFKEVRFKNLGFGEGRQGLAAIIALAATFGTHRNNEDRWSEQPLDCVSIGNTKKIDLWERFKELSKDGGDGTEALWSCVARVLSHRLYCNRPITQTDQRYAKEAERIAKLCNIDLAPMRAEAEAAYPEPKGWQLLNADGTKKGEKPQAKAKSSKPSKRRTPAPAAPTTTRDGKAAGGTEYRSQEEAEDAGVVEALAFFREAKAPTHRKHVAAIVGALEAHQNARSQ